MRSDFLWQNDRPVDAFSIEPSTDRRSSGFWLGDGIFESLLVEEGEIFARRRHMGRLYNALEKIGLNFEWLEERLESALTATLEYFGSKTGQVRVTVLSSGDLLLSAREHEIPQSAIRVLHYPFPKNPFSILAGIKTLSYGENTHALRYAYSRGFDDVLLTNTEGLISESALSNFLAFDGQNWWTPPLSSGCLPGVTRELLIENFSVRERDLHLDDLAEMSALAVTSSLRDIQEISQFEGHSYPALGVVDRLREEFQLFRRARKNP